MRVSYTTKLLPDNKLETRLAQLLLCEPQLTPVMRAQSIAWQKCTSAGKALRAIPLKHVF